ncbi:unnamed protein product [Prunus armeniaca]
MEKSSCLRTLEPRKAVCLWVQAKEISPNKVEWKKVKKFGEDDLTKLRFSAPIKGATFFPAKQDTTNRSKASIPFGIPAK